MKLSGQLYFFYLFLIYKFKLSHGKYRTENNAEFSGCRKIDNIICIVLSKHERTGSDEQEIISVWPYKIYVGQCSLVHVIHVQPLQCRYTKIS